MEKQPTKKFEIPATDVSVGVRPIGSSWRRLPLPACNCDAGTGCDDASNFEQEVSYNNNASNNQQQPYGHCTTGLQFEAPHLKSIWPDGYGYYVATLGGDGKANAKCGGYSETSCNELSYCAWYVEKEVCYETKKGSSQDKDQSLDKGNDPCQTQTDETSCVATEVLQQQESNNKKFCSWYEDKVKKVCYNAETYKRDRQRHLKESNDNDYDMNWSITDKLLAPSEPGDYMLQWRWDNEQTPQIWTTCADIQVTIDGSSASSGATTLYPLLNWSGFLSLVILVATTATGCFW